jgi:enoyl-CoA hydratase/carnithine racemase
MSVRTEVRELDHGTLHVITLDRPEARNALDTATVAALVDTLGETAGDPDLRGVLLTGAGGVFCAGADVREVTEDSGRRRMELLTVLYEQLTHFRVPTAAAIEGPAVGGGAELAGACDLRVAATSATLRFPGASFGVPIGTARTVGQVGLSVAKDWVLSGRDVPASEAHDRGFVQRLVADGQALDEALGWLQQVASRDPATIALLKRLFDDHGGVRDRVAFENDLLRAQAESGALPSLDRDLPGTVRPRRR